MSKNDVYEKYSQTMDDNILRRVLASIPSPDTNRKYRVLHKFICWIWILVFAIELLGLFDLLVKFDVKLLISV